MNLPPIIDHANRVIEVRAIRGMQAQSVSGAVHFTFGKPIFQFAKTGLVHAGDP